MKNLFFLSFLLFTLVSCESLHESAEVDPNLLLGEWILDMSPHEPSDSNFAMMKITKVAEESFQGEFYREGVSIQNAQINTQLGFIYAALVSGDDTGQYNTSFYYKAGVIYGSTHAVDRNFLSVWKANRG